MAGLTRNRAHQHSGPRDRDPTGRW